jgi:Cu/Ag efflux pump CusA
VPLLQDVFWVGMAITIMAGLTFGTLLTMIVVPTLYAMLYRLKKPTSKEETQTVPAVPAPAEA